MGNLRKRLASPALVSFALLWLVLLLIVGTVEQKYIGLYAAQQKYFSSFILWQWGILPLPATKSVLVIISLGIAAKVLHISAWSINKLGNSLAHAGVLFLLVGTLIGGYNKLEGYIVLDEGQSQGYMEDYYSAELVIVQLSDAPGEVQDAIQADNPDAGPDAGPDAEQNYLASHTFKRQQLSEGAVLQTAGLPFSIRIDKFFDNVQLERVSSATRQYDPNEYTGFAKIFKLSDKKSEINREEDLSGTYFTVTDQQNKQVIGRYAVFENMPITQSISYKDDVYQVIMRPQRNTLPFGMQLIDFTVGYHPASAVASDYKSVVSLLDNQLISGQREVIEMNKPLRYKNWTVYQSAFAQTEQQTTSILVAVRNSGRLIPYIAGLIISFGLLLHIFIRLPQLMVRPRNKKAAAAA